MDPISVGMLLIIVFVSLFAIGLSVFWIWMLIDCATRDFKDSNEKLVWILIIIFIQFIGSIVYYFAIKRKNKK